MLRRLLSTPRYLKTKHPRSQRRLSVSCNANNGPGGKRPRTYRCGEQQLQQYHVVDNFAAETAATSADATIRIMGIAEGQHPAMARFETPGARHRCHCAAARQYAADRRW